MSPGYDIVVVGGGAVGAAFAALAVRQARVPASRVIVIERERPPAWERAEAYDLRVVALSRASSRILAAAGAWETIVASRTSERFSVHCWPAMSSVENPSGKPESLNRASCMHGPLDPKGAVSTSSQARST